MKYLFRTRRAPADVTNRLMRATIICVCALCPVASAQTLRPIYAVPELGSVPSWPEPIRPSQTDTAVMKHEILVSARQYWHDQNRNCSEDFRIVGVTTGSFTRVVLQVSNADKFVAERLSCVLRPPTRKGCR